MTVAVCIKCGATKIGAFVRCLSCGYVPTSEEDRAKSVLLSDHNLTNEDLGDVSKRIKSGLGVTFDETSLQQFVESVRIADQDRSFGVRSLACCTCAVVIVIRHKGSRRRM